MDARTQGGSKTVEAKLNYLTPMTERPFSYRYPPPEGMPQTNISHTPYALSIADGRPQAAEFTVDREGFQLVEEPTAVKNFFDEAEVRSVYYGEVEALLKRVTGAEKVVIFDHTLRSAPRAKESKGVREPVRAVHNDYTELSGPQRVRDLLPPAEAEQRLHARFAEINVWRPISEPVEEAPIAICDARSIASEDLVASDLRYRDRNGEIYQARFSPNHRWYYFPQMLRNEALLLKCYDSEKGGGARFTIHTAFDDPTSPSNPKPRESIEVRALLFFPAADRAR